MSAGVGCCVVCCDSCYRRQLLISSSIIWFCRPCPECRRWLVLVKGANERVVWSIGLHLDWRCGWQVSRRTPAQCRTMAPCSKYSAQWVVRTMKSTGERLGLPWRMTHSLRARKSLAMASSSEKLELVSKLELELVPESVPGSIYCQF